jgi:HK97 family phage portal protein
VRFYERWLDKTIKNLGYIKADEAPRVPVAAMFSGEILPGEDQINYASWTDEQMARLAVASAWAYSDIALIAREISQGVFGVNQKQGEKLIAVNDHPFEALIEGRPNRHMSQSFLWQYTITWLLLHGETYWWLVLDKSGELREIYPIPASRMKPIPDPQTFIKFFSYTPRSGAPPKPIPVEQVCFFRLPNPFDYHRGLSPLSAYRLALETDREAAEWNRNSYKKGLALRALISLRETISDPDYFRTKAELRRGVEEGEQYLVARAGDLDIKNLGISQEDAEFLASREFNREEIDRVYGIPAGFWAKEATRANSEAATETLRTFTIWPLMNMLAEDITAQVIIRYYGEGLRGGFNDIRPINRELQIKQEDHDRQIMSLDEVRAAKGLEKFPIPEIGQALFSAAKEIAVNLETSLPLLDDKVTEQAVKAHTPEVVTITCPFCGHGRADRYAEDGGLYVCQGCQLTFNPAVGLWPVNGSGN